MEHITISGQKIEYEFKRSGRAKRMRLSILHDCRINITAPFLCSEAEVRKFIEGNSEWIISKMEYFSKFKDRKLIKTGRADYLKNKELARKVIKGKIERFNEFYRFKFNRIFIKSQKTLWGSCSGDGNLNFNYALIKLPDEMLDYVVVHEMCHLWHFDHSKDFWKLVGLTVPEYRRIRREMKKVVFI